MRLGGLIIKNVLRQKTRTLLTLLGISIGIATIIALGSVADGLKQTFQGILTTGEADFLIAQAGSADMAFSRIDESRLEELRGIDGMAAVEGMVLGITNYKGNPYFMVMGLAEPAVELGGFNVTEGRMASEAGEIALGKIARSSTELRIGDTMDLFGESVEVVGFYETGEQMPDAGGVMGLETVRELTKSGDKITLAFASAERGADINELTEYIDTRFSGELITIKSVDEVSRVDQGAEVVDAASWMISVLAIVIGGIGVMNTMIISVYDRIREIGVLKAVGWRRRTVIAMVLGEAAIIGFAAVGVGSLLALAVLVPLSNSAVVQSFLSPSYTWELWARATAVALLVSILGGLYPAWRAANFSPVEALRYE